MEFRELRAFVAVVEEGSFSAASRRLHVSQPALSQTVNVLERGLGVELLSRSNVGVQPTEAGQALLAHARTLLAEHDRAVADISGRAGEDAGLLRLGVPLELPAGLLAEPLAQLASTFPDTRVQAQHLSTAAQLSALKAGDLDLALVREHPVGRDLDSTLVLEERLGVLLSTERAEALSHQGGIRLESLRGLTWLAFPRSGSPAWFDEVVAVLRSHGLDVAPAPAGEQLLIAEVKLAGVQGGTAFSLAPPIGLSRSRPVSGGAHWRAAHWPGGRGPRGPRIRGVAISDSSSPPSSSAAPAPAESISSVDGGHRQNRELDRNVAWSPPLTPGDRTTTTPEEPCPTSLPSPPR